MTVQPGDGPHRQYALVNPEVLDRWVEVNNHRQEMLEWRAVFEDDPLDPTLDRERIYLDGYPVEEYVVLDVPIVVRAIVDLAKGFGQQTIAEGVESEATAAALRDLGVGFAQGYLFGRPEPLTGAISLPDPSPRV